MRTLERTLGILEAVANQHGACTATLAAEMCNLPLSTTARLMQQLTDHGLLIKDNRTGTYALGARIYRIAEGGRRHLGLSEIARPYLAKLRDSWGETVALHVRAGDQRVCIDLAESHHAVARLLHVGDVNPLIGSATGEVLLAGAPETERKRILDDGQLSDTERQGVEARLDTITRDGYAISMNRWAKGLGSVAVPIRHLGTTVTVINISGPVERLTVAKAHAVIPDLNAAATAISSMLGHRPDN